MTNKGTGSRLFFLVTLLSLGITVAPHAPAVRASSAAPWSATGSMTAARVYHASITLSDGRVLVSGGVDGTGHILASAEMYDPHSGQWSAAGRMSAGRAGVTAALLPDGKVLVAGGASGTFGHSSVLRSAELYVPRTGRWSATGRMATPRYNYAVAVLRNGQVLVCGGVDASGQALAGAELYNPLTGAWRATGSMTVARAAHSATLLPDGRVLVAGGVSGAFGSGPALRGAELYDPRTGRWRTTGRMSEARAVQTATLLPDGDVLVAGGESGQSDSSSVLASAELYHARTGAWTLAGHMAVPRYNQTATLLRDGRVLVAGGQDESVAGQSLASAELYDPRSNIWAVAPAMTMARTGHSAALLPDGRVLVAGGDTRDAAGPTSPSAELYDPRIPDGSIPPVTRPRAQCTATLLRDGRVLVAGGVYALPSTLARSSAELYDPRTGTWALTGSMTTARASQTATLLRDGRVLVAGGFDSAGILAGAELYDPTTGRWMPTGSMMAARAYQTATLLPDGRVLVAGGPGASGATLASAELYDPTTGRWRTAGRMGAARASQTATLLPDGRVLVAGGVSGKANTVLASAELYDPRTGRWTRTGGMSDARAGHTATLLRGGTVLVTGGQEDTSSGAALYSAEVYAPRTGAWIAVSQMTQARVKHTTTLLPDGRVLVAGGEAMPGATLNVVELYDPRSDTWTGASGMTAARAYHAAVLLPSGTVLVMGGVVAGDQTLASAELYTPHTNAWTVTSSM